ncbi:MAG TPA: hypothetical protein VFP59_06130 [Candidatus Angelobacter sp.]|nr:hypothetical protein [Candidatus Angelobacter sp.]
MNPSIRPNQNNRILASLPQVETDLLRRHLSPVTLKLRKPLQRSNKLSFPPSQHVLNSWKEIAGYLGRGVRTVQRWESELGLPVHRPRGRSRSAVLAVPEELDRWLRLTQVHSDGNGNAGHTPAIAFDVLVVARDLLALSERLIKVDPSSRTEAERLTHALREIVDKLTPHRGKPAATQYQLPAQTNCRPDLPVRRQRMCGYESA